MKQAPRPERIAAMRERMVELERAVSNFHDALRESNNEQHQAFFGPVLDRVAQIVANERQGITTPLADDLAVARSSVRRLRLPHHDPDFDELPPSLWRLRGERGNLVEALDNALDTARTLGMEPHFPEFGQLQVERQPFAAQLIRLDERLRFVQEAVEQLQEAAVQADSASHNTAVSQRGLVTVHVRALRVETSAARFETQIGEGLGIPKTADMTALSRTVEVMKELGSDLKETVEGLRDWVAVDVRTAGNWVAKATERSWRGLRTVVTLVRERASVDQLNHVQSDQNAAKPAGFDLDKVYDMILAGMPPPSSWRPWITDLNFIKRPLRNLGPLAELPKLRTLRLSAADVRDLGPLTGLSSLETLLLKNKGVREFAPLAGLINLKTLSLNNTDVRDLTPLSGLANLKTLSMNNTGVSDLAPLRGLTNLETLSLNGTSVSGLEPLAGFAYLETLRVDSTSVSDLEPLAGLASLRTLSLNGTGVSNLGPLSGLAKLETLCLDDTGVSDLRPLASLSSLKALWLNDTGIRDLTPLLDLANLEVLQLEDTGVSNLGPLAGLVNLRTLWLDGTSVSDLTPLSNLPKLEKVVVSSEHRQNELAVTLGKRATILSIHH